LKHPLIGPLAGLLLAITGCTAGQPSTPSAAVPSPDEAQITHPRPGTVLYADTVVIAGIAAYPYGTSLSLYLDSPSWAIGPLAVPVRDNAWSVEVPLPAPGETSALEIALVAGELPDGPRLDLLRIVQAPLATRPAGAFGAIYAPDGSGVTGGDSIPVRGSVSGWGEASLLVALYAGGERIAAAPIAVDHPHPLDEVAWEVDLMSDGFTGPATLRLMATQADESETILDEVDLMFSAVAG
jgi:hypothetical protein